MDAIASVMSAAWTALNISIDFGGIEVSLAQVLLFGMVASIVMGAIYHFFLD